jgi:plastocyanin
MKIPFSLKIKKIIFFSLCVLLVFTTCKKDDDNVYVTATADSTQGAVDFESGEYASGQQITLTASALEGYEFVRWVEKTSGSTYDTNPLVTSAGSNMNFEAVFSSVKYNLSFNVEGKGTVEQEIVSSDSGTELTLGSKVNLKAVPADGHSFFFWNDNIKDTINPIQVTIDENKTIDAKFDFKTAKDLVGTWEFDLENSDGSRSDNKMTMTIDIRLNILITIIIDGNTTTIFSQLTSISSSVIVMGNTGVLSEINFTTSTSVSFKIITIPQSEPDPTSIATIPTATPTNTLSLSGNKTANKPDLITPPTSAITSSTTGDINPNQALTNVVSQVGNTPASCTISGTLSSGPQSQTVSISTAITNVVGTFTYTCSDTLSITASGLPTGVALSTSGNVATISGVPTGTSSGTYNYTVSAVNSTGTASASYSGDITVSVASTTLVPCSGSLTLTSGSVTQTVSASTAITSVNYLVSTNCTDTTTVSATNLPPGVTMNYTSSSGAVVVSGTPSGAATGTYNYSILAMFAPTSDTTASATISGFISIAATTSSSTTASSSIFSIDVTATSSSDYTLSGTDRNGSVSGNDPTITIASGDTINFNVSAAGHPFYLKTVAGTGTGDTISGLDNNGTTNNTISWTPTANGTFYYQCSLHGGMVGTITVQ